jgi:hypothetical protein
VAPPVTTPVTKRLTPGVGAGTVPGVLVY